MVTALNPLPLTGAEVRAVCLPGMRAGARKDRVVADLANIEGEEIALRKAITGGHHRAFRSLTTFDDNVRADMMWFYENRLRDSVPGREIWDSILALAGRRCPFCHLAKPRTLEHSYPQSKFPRLAVEPLNLVPACHECNIVRNVGHGSITISPYMDSWVVNQPWLRAEVLDTAHPEDLRFLVSRHPSFTDDEWLALQRFVEDIDLLDRYVALAIDAFSEFLEEVRLHYRPPSQSDAQTLLMEKVVAHTSSYGINRWQTVAFETWHREAIRIDWAALA